MTIKTVPSRKAAFINLSLFLSLIALIQLPAFTAGFEALRSAEAFPALNSISAGIPSGLTLPPLPAPAAVEGTGLDATDSKIYYVNPWNVDLAKVPAPPADGSAADKDDMRVVRQWQADRTDAQCAAALAQENSSFDEFFGAVSPFVSPTPAEVETVFAHVRVDAGAVAGLLKEKYRRPRPFVRDSSITPCLGRESGFAYPSGHATVSRVFGRILSGLAPVQQATFMAYADQAALNRVIGGVHHPSDIEEGKQLGDLVYQALLKNSSFMSDLNNIRKYLANPCPH